MKNVLITGGTGFLGSNLAHALLKEGCQVRILRRASSDLRALGQADVEQYIGDVLQPDSLRKAVNGCDTVFHTAAVISYWRREREQMMQVNVTGTRNMIEACVEAGVSKFVHTSSIAAIGFRTDGAPADETTAFNWDTYDVGYRISKHRAELEVLKGIKLGLPAVVVNPSVIVGPRDIHFHGGQLLRDIARKRIFYYTEGSMNIVFVDDVVRGHIQAARAGRTGERYILGGENITLKNLFRLTAEITGGISPFFKLSTGSIRAVAALSESIGNLLRSRPWISRELVAGLGLSTHFTSDKARHELGYATTPLPIALQKTYEWYRENNFL